MKRRQLVQMAAALAFARAANPVAAAALLDTNMRFKRDPFTLGVASGMPRADSVVLWTRLAPEPLAEDGLGGVGARDLELAWELATDEQFAGVVKRGNVRAFAANAHSVRVKVSGLDAARNYFYRFTVGGGALAVTSPVGRTRTAPAADANVQSLRLALASCMHYEAGFFTAFRDMAARELDAVLFVGDYIYESNYGKTVRLRAHETATEPTTLVGYRNRYANTKLDRDLQAAHAAHPWILTWDDHEVDNDYANDESQDSVRGEVFLQRRAAAYKAYFEHQPFDPELAPRGPDMRVYDRYEWGQLAEIWTLDDRQYRSPHACAGTRHGNVANCAELFAPERTLLGAQQEAWLHSGLKQSKRQWKLIGQPTIIAQTAELTSAGRMYWNEGWDGYQASRDKLLATIGDNQLSNVVSLAGDVHMNVACDIKRSFDDSKIDKSPVIASEFVGTSMTSRSRAQEAWTKAIETNPHLKHLRSDERGYALVTVTPKQASCEFLTTVHPVAADAKFVRQAKFAADAGRAGVYRA
jgi:alkaline phosphatase D